MLNTVQLSCEVWFELQVAWHVAAFITKSMFGDSEFHVQKRLCESACSTRSDRRTMTGESSDPKTEQPIALSLRLK